MNFDNPGLEQFEEILRSMLFVMGVFLEGYKVKYGDLFVTFDNV